MRKIILDSVLDKKDNYLVCCYMDLNNLDPYDYVENSERFYKKAPKTIEVAISNAIAELLSEYDINFIDNDSDSYIRAFDKIGKLRKKLLIYNDEDKSCGKVAKKTQNDTFYITNDNYLLLRKVVQLVNV